MKKYIKESIIYTFIFLTGYFVGSIKKTKEDGSILIDHTKPSDGNNLFLELYIPMDEVKTKDVIHFKVIHKKDISH